MDEAVLLRSTGPYLSRQNQCRRHAHELKQTYMQRGVVEIEVDQLVAAWIC
jgi:hypothetical protein